MRRDPFRLRLRVIVLALSILLKTLVYGMVGILIFIAAGLLATYWIGKMRREMDDKKPRLALASLVKTP